MEGASSIDLTSPILKSMIRQTLFAVADTDAKPVHTGTLFNIENGIIRLVSVDGYRLAMRTEMINLKFEEEDEIRFVVPGKTLAEIAKLLSDEPPVRESRKRLPPFRYPAVYPHHHRQLQPGIPSAGRRIPGLSGCIPQAIPLR